MARFVPARSPQLEEWHPEAQVFVQMSPATFLYNLGTAGTQEGNLGGGFHIDKSSLMLVKERLEKEQELDPLYIDYDPYKNQIVRHEGRHRAVAAMQLGIPTVPVYIFFYDDGKDGRKHEVKDKWGNVYDYTRYVSLEEIGPTQVQRILTRLGAERTERSQLSLRRPPRPRSVRSAKVAVRRHVRKMRPMGAQPPD